MAMRLQRCIERRRVAPDALSVATNQFEPTAVELFKAAYNLDIETGIRRLTHASTATTMTVRRLNFLFITIRKLIAPQATLNSLGGFACLVKFVPPLS